MPEEVRIPREWAGTGVQLPLFVEQPHEVEVREIRAVEPKRVWVKWKCVDGSDLVGREFVETFDLACRRGRERLKGFLLAMQIQTKEGRINLDSCRGNSIQAVVVSRPVGKHIRIEIVHHLLTY
jgi:hypothetical protein